MAYYRVQNAGERLPTRSISWDGEDAREGMSVCTSWSHLVSYFSTRSTLGYLTGAELVVCDGVRATMPDCDEHGESADAVALLDPASVVVLRRRPLSRHEIRALLGGGGRADRFAYDPAPRITSL